MAEASKTSAAGHSKRTRAIAWGVGTVLVLALVILGMSAISSPKPSGDSSDTQSAAPETAASDSAEQSSLLYERALQAQRSGDTTKAAELAQQSLDADAGNAKAKQLLATLAAVNSAGAGGAPSTSPTTPSAATTATAAVPTMARVKSIATLLPAQAKGYTFDTAVVQGKDAVVSADPVVGSADSRLVTHALFAVHDRGTEKAAKAFVTTVNKRLYSKNRATVTVLGGPGYFGTDGTRLAAVAFSRGPYAFEVVLTVPGNNPVDARAAALSLAQAFRIP